MYSFLFDRRSLVLLFAGMATAGCLLFVSGLLVGVFYGLPFAAPAPAAVSLPPRPTARSAASRPCPPAPEPALRAEAGDDGEAVPLFAGGAVERRDEPAETEARPSPPRSRPLLPPEPEEAPWARSLPYAALRPADPAPAAAEPPSLIPAAAPAAPEVTLAALGSPGATLSEAPLAPAGRYSLQVGAYRRAENSARAVEELQSLGYDAYVVEEGKGGALLSVRVGRYAERSEALRAALEFRQRQGREAIVRTIGL